MFNKITEVPLSPKIKHFESLIRRSHHVISVLQSNASVCAHSQVHQELPAVFYKPGLQAENSGASSLSLKLLRGFRVV